MITLTIYCDSMNSQKSKSQGGGGVDSMKEKFWEEQVKQLTTKNFNLENQRALKILINTNGFKKILQPDANKNVTIMKGSYQKNGIVTVLNISQRSLSSIWV